MGSPPEPIHDRDADALLGNSFSDDVIQIGMIKLAQ
jgi:hypothetical protein